MNMTKPPSEILGWLWHGHCGHFMDRKVLDSLKISHVINVGRVPGVVKHEWPPDRLTLCPLSDHGHSRLDKSLPVVLDALVSCKERGDHVLLHCEMGVNRSTTAIAAYLVKHEGMSLKAALSHILEVRVESDPHPIYIQQLRELEVRWKGLEISTFSRQHEFEMYNSHLPGPHVMMKVPERILDDHS